jgi:hypothetical protein
LGFLLIEHLTRQKNSPTLTRSPVKGSLGGGTCPATNRQLYSAWLGRAMFMHADGCCRRGRAVSHVFIAGEFNLNLGCVYLGNLKIQKYRCNLKVQIYISSTCFPKSGVIILPDFVSYTHFYLQSLELSSTSSTFHLSSTTTIQQV